MKVKEVRVALADDHVLFRKGMVELINDIDGYRVTLEADVYCCKTPATILTS